jgi:hypothetical protein
MPRGSRQFCAWTNTVHGMARPPRRRDKGAWMDLADRGRLRWIKSSGSDANNCVEVAFDGAFVYVRDSKDPCGAVLVLTRNGWRAFLADIVGGLA